MQTSKEPFLAIVSRLDEEGMSIVSPQSRELACDPSTPKDQSSLEPIGASSAGPSSLAPSNTPKPLRIAFKGALPGEEVLLLPKYKKYKTLLASLLAVKTPSVDRVDPPCSHFLTCGGCSLQHLAYKKQLELKQGKIRELFPDEGDIRPILPAKMEWGYRGKMEFTFSEDKKGQKYLGLYGEDGKVLLNQTECSIASPWMQDALKIVKDFWESSSYSAFHLSKMDGALRYLTLRGSFRTPAKMVILTQFGGATEPVTLVDLQKLKRALEECLGEISFFVKVDHIAKGTPSTFSEIHLGGPKALYERLVLKDLELACEISPSSFYQPNPSQAEVIYQTALDLTEKLFEENKLLSILDLFSGIGMLGLVFAARAKKHNKNASVTCVELSPYACYDAEAMLEKNGLSSSEGSQEKNTQSGVVHCEIVKADAFAYLEKKQGKYDLVIVDPPRIGLDKALELCGGLNAPYILYISCNPKSQSNDIAYLKTLQYKVLAIQPIDQFPHTFHLENVILLAK